MRLMLFMLSMPLFALPGLAACSTTEAEIEDVVWVLEAYGEPGNLKNPVPGTRITAEFVGAEGTLKGSAGCNSYFGGYELRANRLSLPGPLAVTEMYCMQPEGVMEQEKEYLDALQAAGSYEISGGKLRVNCGSRLLVFGNGRES